MTRMENGIPVDDGLCTKNRKRGKFSVKRLVILFRGNYTGAVIMLVCSLNGSATGNFGQAVGYLTALLLISLMEWDTQTITSLRGQVYELEKQSKRSLFMRV